MAKSFLISVIPVMRLPLTRDQSFFYTHSAPLLPGTRVTIPVGKRTVEGVVRTSHADFARAGSLQIKPIEHVDATERLTTTQIALADFIAETSFCPLGIVMKNFLPKDMVARKKTLLPLPSERLFLPDPEHHVINEVLSALNTHGTALLQTTYNVHAHEAIATVIRALLGRSRGQILILVPENTLVPIYERMISAYCKEFTFVAFAADLSKGQSSQERAKVRTGQTRIVLGTRRTLFMPFAQLVGVIVLESHDMSHKQSLRAPRYDARTVAQHLATIADVPFLRVSPSPSISEYVHASVHKQLYILPPHPGRLTVIDMKNQYWKMLTNGRKVKSHHPVSEELAAVLSQNLARGEKSLLFINRQGATAFSVCTKCKEVMRCPTCERALVERTSGRFTCLHCSYKTDVFPTCAHCSSITFQGVGVGTEKIAMELKKRLPRARIAVIDSTTMQRTATYRKIYTDFMSGKIDILIGTQMATKGWDHPDLTLAAIIDMDMLLAGRDFDAHERAYGHVLQLMTHVAPHGTLYIQAFDTNHTLMRHIMDSSWESFVAEESDMRELLKFPPFARLLLLTYLAPSLDLLEKESRVMYEKLQSIPHIIVGAPHDPLVPKIRTQYRKNIVIKLPENKVPPALQAVLISLDQKWVIDVDPTSIT